MTDTTTTYPANDPTFAIFYTGTSDNSPHVDTVRAADADVAARQFELHTGITDFLVVPVVDVTATA